MAEPVPSVAPAQTTILQPPIIQLYKPCCNPCPCMPLDLGVANIALFEMVLHASHLIWIIAVIVTYFIAEKESQWDIIFLSYFIVCFLISLVCLILGIFLRFGARQWSGWKCCVYFIGRSISQIILIIILIVYAVGEANKKPLTSNEYGVIAALCILIFIGMYSLFVVYVFMEQIKFYPTRPVYRVPDQQSQPRVVPPLSSDANGGTATASGVP